MTWTVDNLWIFGEVKEGRYVLLKDGSEVARGTDPVELRLIAHMLNQCTQDMRVKALDSVLYGETHGQAA